MAGNLGGRAHLVECLAALAPPPAFEASPHKVLDEIDALANPNQFFGEAQTAIVCLGFALAILGLLFWSGYSIALQIDQLMLALDQGLHFLEQKMADLGFAPVSRSVGGASIGDLFRFLFPGTSSFDLPRFPRRRGTAAICGTETFRPRMTARNPEAGLTLPTIGARPTDSPAASANQTYNQQERRRSNRQLND